MPVDNVLVEEDNGGGTTFTVLEDPEEYVDECEHPADRIRFVEFSSGENGYLCIDCGADNRGELDDKIIHERLREKMEEKEAEITPHEWVDLE